MIVVVDELVGARAVTLVDDGALPPCEIVVAVVVNDLQVGHESGRNRIVPHDVTVVVDEKRAALQQRRGGVTAITPGAVGPVLVMSKSDG